jgi:hypothetical protein
MGMHNTHDHLQRVYYINNKKMEQQFWWGLV